MSRAALDGLAKELRAFARMIDAPSDLLPAYVEGGRGGEGLWISIEGEPPIYRLSYFERGRSDLVLLTADRDALLERIMDSVTFSLASKGELANRRMFEDSRIQLFEIQEALMGKLRPSWQENLHARHAELLDRHPPVASA